MAKVISDYKSWGRSKVNQSFTLPPLCKRFITRVSNKGLAKTRLSYRNLNGAASFSSQREFLSPVPCVASSQETKSLLSSTQLDSLLVCLTRDSSAWWVSLNCNIFWLKFHRRSISASELRMISHNSPGRTRCHSIRQSQNRDAAFWRSAPCILISPYSTGKDALSLN